jgi:hypothetical protein
MIEEKTRAVVMVLEPEEMRLLLQQKATNFNESSELFDTSLLDALFVVRCAPERHVAEELL